MRKTLATFVAATSIAAAAMAMSTTAEARWGWGWGPGCHGGWYGYRGWRYGGWGWGPGAVAGGFVVGSALAARPYYYPYGHYGYAPYPAYGPRCRNVWNGYAWVRACY
jgi:hypothetical protein